MRGRATRPNPKVTSEMRLRLVVGATLQGASGSAQVMLRPQKVARNGRRHAEEEQQNPCPPGTDPWKQPLEHILPRDC